jgi:hypothetical protein
MKKKKQKDCSNEEKIDYVRGGHVRKNIFMVMSGKYASG